MIQRQQTLWLLLSAIASFLTFEFPFYVGNKTDNGISAYAELDAGSNLFLVVLTGFSTLLALVTIFVYKERKNQLKMAITGIILAAILLALYISGVKKFDTGRFTLTSVLAIAILFGYIMAARGIWKDQKLVKSLDKLR